jgi:hypothetical protein
MSTRVTTESKNALEMERRKLLLESANAAYAKIREDPIASREFDEETTSWDFTLLDGLKNI